MEKITHEPIKIYPNPTTDYFTIETDVQIENITLLNLAGDRIAMRYTDNRIDVSDLAAGIFILYINDEKALKLIKQ